MSVEAKGPAAASIIERAKNILMSPKTEWDRIDAEPASIKGIYIGYVCILAAIAPIANLIGSQLFPAGFMGIVYRPPIISSIVIAIVGYVGTLVGVYVTALIIDALAPSFGGTKDQLKAFKVAAYSWTAAWIAGIFSIVPMLAWLGIAGLYSLYLLYLGLPKLMKSPQDKSLGYTAVVIIVCIVVNAVIFGLIGAVSAMAIGGAARMGNYGAANNGTLTVNGGNGSSASINLGQLAAAGKAMEAQAKAAEAAANSGTTANGGTVKPIASDVLSGMLPGQINGFARGEVSSSSGSAMGMSGSNAEATYAKGDAHFTLTVTDLGSAGAISAMAGAFGVNSNRQSGAEYEKVNTVNGQMVMEKFNTQTKVGEYSITAGRFAVQASGSGAEMNDLKAAVSSISLGALQSKAS
jgi:hypothetical protein